MAPLPQERVGPAPIFDAVAIDLFGPLEFKDMVRKKISGKGWGSFLSAWLLQPSTWN